ncbi:MAG: NotI family restriction endonuclease [Dissulfurispiraceae bacterium]
MAEVKKKGKKKKDNTRYGIGEWFGHIFTNLSIEERQTLAGIALKKSFKDANQSCPFKRDRGSQAICNKKGGVCTLRRYKNDNGVVIPVQNESANFVTICPRRFFEGDSIFRTIGTDLLNDSAPEIISEMDFLLTKNREDYISADTMTEDSFDGKDDKPVGRIDIILVTQKNNAIHWNALEMQAVYFSGEAMKSFFQILESNKEQLPFPDKNRRPDWRSSGPKRLMPQLQVKVPTIRRWGKKLAIVVDLAFFSQMEDIPQANDISNSDIIWYVVDYEIPEPESDSSAANLIIKDKKCTTLERSVESLVGGDAMPLGQFEKQILEKLDKKRLI